MTTTCACSAVRLTLEQAPDYINDCNCDLCRKVGGAWGYFEGSQVQVSGKTQAFKRTDKVTPAVVVHACEVCSTTTHFTLSEAFLAQNPTADQVGVNMRLFNPALLEGVEVRFPDGMSWDGASEFGYRREPKTISKTWRW